MNMNMNIVSTLRACPLSYDPMVHHYTSDLAQKLHEKLAPASRESLALAVAFAKVANEASRGVPMRDAVQLCAAIAHAVARGHAIVHAASAVLNSSSDDRPLDRNIIEDLAGLILTMHTDEGGTEPKASAAMFLGRKLLEKETKNEYDDLAYRLLRRATRLYARMGSSEPIGRLLPLCLHHFGRDATRELIFEHCCTRLAQAFILRRVPTELRIYDELRARAQSQQAQAQAQADVTTGNDLPADGYEHASRFAAGVLRLYRERVVQPYLDRRAACDERLRVICHSRTAGEPTRHSAFIAELVGPAAFAPGRLADPRTSGNINTFTYLELDMWRDVEARHYQQTSDITLLASRYIENTVGDFLLLRQEEPRRVMACLDEIAAALTRPQVHPQRTEAFTGLDGPTHALDALIGVQGESYREVLVETYTRAVAGAFASTERAGRVAEYLSAPGRLLFSAGLTAIVSELRGHDLEPFSSALQCTPECDVLSGAERDVVALLSAALTRGGINETRSLRLNTVCKAPPELLRAWCALAMTNPSLAAPALRDLLWMERLELRTDGSGVSTFASFAASIVRAACTNAAAAAGISQPRLTGAVVESLVPATAARAPLTADALDAMLGLAVHTTTRTGEFIDTRGRTLLFRDAESIIALKLLKHGEPPAALHHELQQQMAKRSERTASVIPEPLGVYESTRSLHPHLAERVRASGIMPRDPVMCLAYRTTNPGLFTYVNDCDDDNRALGLRAAAVDLMRWLRRGDVMTALTVKNHNGSVDRPYYWLVDLCYPPEVRRGMGRMDAVDFGLTYANIRQTGIADLAELRTIDAIIAELDDHADLSWAHDVPLQFLACHGREHLRNFVLAYISATICSTLRCSRPTAFGAKDACACATPRRRLRSRSCMTRS